MTITVAEIWRYPIKGVGAEKLTEANLKEGLPLPLDRAWAVLEKGGELSDGWVSCRNFLRGAKGPSLMAVIAKVDGENITLSHPHQSDITLSLSERGAPALFEWIKNLYPDNRPPAAKLVKAPETGMADVSFASVSFMNMSSLRAVSDKAGRALNLRRFRGNIWLEGLAPWEEFDLIGKSLTIGDAVLEVVEPIRRCRATEANPETGKRDMPVLQLLEQGWGHTEFGVNAKVTVSGTIKLGNEVIVR